MFYWEKSQMKMKRFSFYIMRDAFSNKPKRKNLMKKCTAVLLAFLVMTGTAVARETNTISEESLPPVQRVEEGYRFRPHHRRRPHHPEIRPLQGSAAEAVREDFPAAGTSEPPPPPAHHRRRLPRPLPESAGKSRPAADLREPPPPLPHHMYGDETPPSLEPVAVLTDSD